MNMGHIHCGFDNIEIPFKGSVHRYKVDKQRAEIVKAADLFIGIPGLIMEPDNKRRELYGKAGAFRPKRYGVELRGPSNFWLANNKLKKWAFDSTVNLFKFINTNGFLDNDLSEFVRDTIDTGNKKQAHDLVKQFNLLLV